MFSPPCNIAPQATFPITPFHAFAAKTAHFASKCWEQASNVIQSTTLPLSSPPSPSLSPSLPPSLPPFLPPSLPLPFPPSVDGSSQLISCIRALCFPPCSCSSFLSSFCSHRSEAVCSAVSEAVTSANCSLTDSYHFPPQWRQILCSVTKVSFARNTRCTDFNCAIFVQVFLDLFTVWGFQTATGSTTEKKTCCSLGWARALLLFLEQYNSFYTCNTKTVINNSSWNRFWIHICIFLWERGIQNWKQKGNAWRSLCWSQCSCFSMTRTGNTKPH